MRRLIPALMAGLLVGCSNQLAIRQAQLNAWIGRPETELISVFGVPDRTYETKGVKFIAYTEQRVDLLPGPPGYAFGPPFGLYPNAMPPQAVALTCDTSFAIVGGTVRSYSLRGNACG